MILILSVKVAYLISGNSRFVQRNIMRFILIYFAIRQMSFSRISPKCLIDSLLCFVMMDLSSARTMFHEDKKIKKMI